MVRITGRRSVTPVCSVRRPETRMRSILVLLLLAVPLYAHNGAITAVVPVDGIVVDGDLSDWPEHVSWQPISIPSAGLRPFDADDFSGRFRLGSDADERLRIVAVEVQDESVMPDASGQGRAQMVCDGCEIHLDLDHTVEGNPPLIRHTLWGSEHLHMVAVSTDSFENAVALTAATSTNGRWINPSRNGGFGMIVTGCGMKPVR